jgi:hypothetical protein
VRAEAECCSLHLWFPWSLTYDCLLFTCWVCGVVPAGHCFASMDGQPAAQGFVTALLHDKQSGRSLLVAATHLKAKAGADNEQTRVHQVRLDAQRACASACCAYAAQWLLHASTHVMTHCAWWCTVPGGHVLAVD